MRNRLTYREHRPPQDLSSWVAAYWHIQGALPPDAGIRHRVLPDGCADLLIDCQTAHDSTNSQGILVGPMLVAQQFELRGTVDMIGVRFRPGGASRIFGLPLHHIRDDAVTLSDLSVDWPLGGAELSELSDSSRRDSLDRSERASGRTSISGQRRHDTRSVSSPRKVSQCPENVCWRLR